MPDRDSYVTANRAAWNEVAPRHREHNQQRLVELFRAGGYNHLEDILQELLLQAGVGGKSVVQAGCNNGIDLLAAKGMGAGRCLGIDQAEAFLDHARELAEAAGVAADVSFMAGNIYALPPELAGSFDIASTTAVQPWAMLSWL